MKKNIAALIFGLLLIFAGLGFVGAEFFNWNFSIFFDGWWTLFIIVPAFASILSNGARTSNLVVLGIGLVLLLRAQNLISSHYIWVFIVAIVLVAVGASLIFGFFKKPNVQDGYFTFQGNNSPQGAPQAEGSYEPSDGDTQTASQANGAQNGYQYSYNPNYTYSNPKSSSGWAYDQSSSPNYSAFMSGITMKNTSNDFQGGRISVVMGGADIDLRDVIMTKDVVIYVSAVMGGIDIYAPKNVRIAISKSDILGGTDCVAPSMPPDANVPVCTFVCTTVMAGIDIK